LRVNPSDLVGQADIARMLGWTSAKVGRYAAMGTFPKPIAHPSSGRLWLRQDIEKWAKERGYLPRGT
jgi:predicted DNA-binding transcriptional regulator AlpA